MVVGSTAGLLASDANNSDERVTAKYSRLASQPQATNQNAGFRKTRRAWKLTMTSRIAILYCLVTICWNIAFVMGPTRVRRGPRRKALLLGTRGQLTKVRTSIANCTSQPDRPAIAGS